MTPVVPDEFNVIPPGVDVTVHEPTDGNPLKFTIPVGVVQVGCVMDPVIGGVGENKLITTFDDGNDVHNVLVVVTVKVYVVLDDRPLKVVADVLPDCVKLPGDEVIVQFPDGNPESSTLPVGVKHDG